MLRKHTRLRLADQIVLLLLTALFFITPVWADDPPQSFEAIVESNQSGPLSGLKVYAFTESGSYTGKNSNTDESGTALFLDRINNSGKNGDTTENQA